MSEEPDSFKTEWLQHATPASFKPHPMSSMEPWVSLTYYVGAAILHLPSKDALLLRNVVIIQLALL